MTTTEQEIARELRRKLEQYFVLIDASEDPEPHPQVKWLCEPEEIDAMILRAFQALRDFT